MKLPASIKAAATRLAEEDGVSLNQWIALAVPHKVGAVETAAAFFTERAAGSAAEELQKILDKGPDVAPEPHDRLRE